MSVRSLMRRIERHERRSTPKEQPGAYKPSQQLVNDITKAVNAEIRRLNHPQASSPAVAADRFQKR